MQLPALEELEPADLTDLPSGLVDIDILIGDPDSLAQRVGTRALELLLARLRCEPSVASAGLGTSASNRVRPGRSARSAHMSASVAHC